MLPPDLNADLNNEDLKLENYLRGFRPRPAEALPVKHGFIRRVVVLAAAAAILLVAFAALLRRGHTVGQTISRAVLIEQPLTIRSANAFLADAPSVKTAVDRIAFSSREIALPTDQQSAFSVLGQEKSKL